MIELKNKKHVIWTGDLNVAHNEIDISSIYISNTKLLTLIEKIQKETGKVLVLQMKNEHNFLIF